MLPRLGILERQEVESMTSKFAFALEALVAHKVSGMEPLCTTRFAYEFSLVASMIHPLGLRPICIIVPNLALAASQGRLPTLFADHACPFLTFGVLQRMLRELAEAEFIKAFDTLVSLVLVWGIPAL